MADRIVVMEPGKIRTIVDVNIPHPRKRDDLVGKKKYDDLHKKLITSFYNHVEENIYEEVFL